MIYTPKGRGRGYEPKKVTIFRKYWQVFFWMSFWSVVKVQKNFFEKIHFWRFAPQKQKEGDQGAEIGHFQDILKTYTDLEVY